MQEFTFAIKLTGPEPDNSRTIYHVAQAFYLAGNRTALNIEVGPNLTQSLLSPSVVNYCFALELFFKALIQNSDKKPPQTHKLLELFELLSDAEKTSIREQFNSQIQDPNFESFLQTVSEYFVKVRYEYEYPVEVYYEGPIAVFAKIVYVLCSETFGEGTKLPRVSV